LEESQTVPALLTVHATVWVLVLDALHVPPLHV